MLSRIAFSIDCDQSERRAWSNAIHAGNRGSIWTQQSTRSKAAIDAAARYFRDLLRRFDGRLDLAFAAYNAGEGAVGAFKNGRVLRLSNGKVINAARLVTGGIPPYRETQNYVRLAIDLLRGRGLLTTMPLGRSKTNVSLTTTRDFTIDVTLTETHPGSLA